ncbi:phosphatidylserine decarboxylase [Vaginisenegalia massiliensis]|uniref:phosphatidylserine decarboxylase n=1 Tax=Vaginisenegalia massiliensis TaxID=2058294 RepID=UPI000F546361|nr:phosphatidylserine decarboxylase [Vaginisenegalia massiliensis]
MAKYYDLTKSKWVQEQAYQDGLLKRLYGSNLLRKLILAWLVRPFFTKVYSWWDYTPLSKGKIERFCQTYDIDLSCYQDGPYKTFAAFFKRQYQDDQIKLWNSQQIGAVAQAKLQVYTVDETLSLRIKDQDYSLVDLLVDEPLANLFRGGMAFLYRLGVEDYHRYLACETGQVRLRRRLAGKLHSVRQLAQDHYPVFKENVRQYCLLDTKDGFPVIQMEIGALLVGKIHNSLCAQLEAGQEKGYFGLGGSAILVLYPAKVVEVSEEINRLSQAGFECQVQIGQVIGEKICLND